MVNANFVMWSIFKSSQPLSLTSTVPMWRSPPLNIGLGYPQTNIEPSQEPSMWRSRGPSGCTIPGYAVTHESRHVSVERLIHTCRTHRSSNAPCPPTPQRPTPDLRRFLALHTPVATVLPGGSIFATLGRTSPTSLEHCSFYLDILSWSGLHTSGVVRDENKVRRMCSNFYVCCYTILILRNNMINLRSNFSQQYFSTFCTSKK